VDLLLRQEVYDLTFSYHCALFSCWCKLREMLLIIGYILILYITYRVYQQFFPAPNIDAHGKYILISGCDTGFGHRLAIELDKQGFHVFAGVYNADSKGSLTEQLSLRATVFPLDITRQQDIEAAYHLVKEKTNTLHALVNNAGIIISGYIDWVSVESMRNLMDVNFFGHVAMTKTFLPLLLAKRDSRVVNVCSIAGFTSTPANSAYSTSKHALESFSDCLRREMAAWGLRVSIIEPGIMRTPIIGKHDQSLHESRKQLPADILDRWGNEYLKKQLEKTKSNILLKYAEDPIKVVRALQHAVTSTAPRIRYRPGWQSSLIFFPLSMIPTWLADLFFAKTRGLDVPPLGIEKQLKA
jgi:NAD(P)-dependent dehydrogenase (short-subunit alcohol dehydrogenase family)